jgi:prophage regulatory protein
METERKRSAPLSSHIIRMQHLPGIIGLSRSSIYRLEADGDFPRRRKLGKTSKSAAVGWIRSEVDEWMATRELA